MTFDGEKLRVDYLGTTDKRTATTPFLLTLDNGNSWVLGNEGKEQYYCTMITMNEFFKTIGDLVTKVDSYTNVKYTDTSVEKILEEDGPTIQGYPTVHVRIKTSSKVKASVLVKTFEFHVEKVDDFWYTKNRQMHPARQSWIAALTNSGYAHLDSLSQQVRSHVKGALLQQETMMQVMNVKKKKTDTFGRKIHITSIQEVKASELAADTFTKPQCQDINKDQVKDIAGGMFKEGKLTL